MRKKIIPRDINLLSFSSFMTLENCNLPSHSISFYYSHLINLMECAKMRRLELFSFVFYFIIIYMCLMRLNFYFICFVFLLLLQLYARFGFLRAIRNKIKEKGNERKINVLLTLWWISWHSSWMCGWKERVLFLMRVVIWNFRKFMYFCHVLRIFLCFYWIILGNVDLIWSNLHYIG